MVCRATLNSCVVQVTSGLAEIINVKSQSHVNKHSPGWVDSF